MEKRKMDFAPLDDKSFTHNKQTIIVKPYLSNAEMVSLINIYTSIYFFPSTSNTIKGLSEWDYISAQRILYANIIDMCTNVKTFDDDGKIVENIESIVLNIWNNVKENISNYDEFYFSLDRVVNDIKRQMEIQKSVGNMIDNFSKSLHILFDKLSKIDLSPESIEKLKEVTASFSKELEDSPIGGLIKESQKS